MSTIQYFISQLSSTQEGLLNSFLKNEKNINVVPPFDSLYKRLIPDFEPGSRYFGTWSRHRLFYHIVMYEKEIAIPNLKLWVDKLDDIKEIATEEHFERYTNQDKTYDVNIPLDELISDFKELRNLQIKQLQQLSDEDLQIQKNASWGLVSLDWVISKTIQHSYEHGNKMYRHALFWDGPYGRLTQLKANVDKQIEDGKKIDTEAYKELIEFIENSEN